MASRKSKAPKCLFNYLDWFCIFIGILTSVATIILVGDERPPLYVLAGLVALNGGIIGTLLGIKGRRSNFIFAALNAISYGYTAWCNQFYGSAIINILVYMPFSFFGFYSWSKNRNANKEVIARKLTIRQLALFTIAIILSTIALNGILILFDGSSTILDSAATILVLFATILAVLRYREQWVVWLIADILQLIMWTTTNDPAILVMRIFFPLSSIYGFINWRKLVQKPKKSKKR